MITRLILCFALILSGQSSISQSLHSLEPIKKHYLELSKLDGTPNPSTPELNAMRYPTNARSSGKQFIGISPTYLSLSQVTLLKESMQFPSNSSAQTRAELDYLLKLEAERTDTQKKRAWVIARIGYWPPLEKTNDYSGANIEDLFWEYEQVTDREINPDAYPATTKLLAGVTRDMRIMEFTVKYHLMRPRPYHLEPRLNSMTRISNPSFASGHTLWAYIQAFTWSELIPSMRKQFLDIAYEVGESREIMGIHYPSDEEAAGVLAHKMLTAMWTNPSFLADLRAAKEEWK